MKPASRSDAPEADTTAAANGRVARLLALWHEAKDEAIAGEAMYITLREAILSGVLLPGERLGEEYLAKLFERSRTPVREAILRLEIERLAERSAGRGFVVGRITRDEVLEVYAVRGALDALAARLAAHGILPAELDQLRWLNGQLREAAAERDYARMLDLNMEFHEAVCRASRNALLLQFVRQIHDWVRRFPQSTFAYKGRAEAANDEHDQLIAALAKGDSERAEGLARAHMERAQQVRVTMLQDGPADPRAWSGRRGPRRLA
jgi:DNA-binding GntR family transcriptional regulator